MRSFLIASLLTFPALAYGQSPAPEPERAVAESEAAPPLPVRRVIL